jgi:hypothetical protein
VVPVAGPDLNSIVSGATTLLHRRESNSIGLPADLGLGI